MTGHHTNVYTQFEKSSTMMKVGKMEKRDYQYKEKFFHPEMRKN